MGGSRGREAVGKQSGVQGKGAQATGEAGDQRAQVEDGSRMLLSLAPRMRRL